MLSNHRTARVLCSSEKSYRVRLQATGRPSFLLGRRTATNSSATTGTLRWNGRTSPAWIVKGNFSSRNVRSKKLSTQKPTTEASITYGSLLKDYPIATKALTSGIISGSADAACQLLIEKKSPKSRYDFMRSLRFAFLGMALVGPVCHHWYGFLAQRLPSQTTVGVAKRVALDQFVFAPVFLSCFCSSLWMLEQRQFGSFNTYFEHLRNTMPAVIATNWGLWIPSMALNFRFVPVQYQVLASNIIAVVWNVYLSFKATKKSNE